MQQFDITSPAIIYCGAGTFAKIANETARLGNRAGVITGAHLYDSDCINLLLEDLADRGVGCCVPDPITSEPTVDTVDELARLLRSHRADVVVAVGGGSVIDAAKAAAVMARNEGITEDYQLARREVAFQPLAQVAVPTTAGTGSEATRVSVLTNTTQAIKRSVSHSWMTPNVAVLDPELTVSLSKYLTTISAMDAFAHAIESAVSQNANAYTRHVALAAIEKLSEGLSISQQSPTDLDGRLACLMGSCYAGLAMQAGLGAAHSLAPAVCIVGGIRHAEAIAALLPNAITLNAQAYPDVYDDMCRSIGRADPATSLRHLCTAGGCSTDLKHFGLGPENWGDILQTMNRYASHRLTNPVPVTDDYARELYEMSCG